MSDTPTFPQPRTRAVLPKDDGQMVGTAAVSTLNRTDGRVVCLNEEWIEDAASKSLSTDELAIAVYADIQDARQRIQHLEKMLADQQAKRTSAESVEEEELAFLLSVLKKGVQCCAKRGRFSDQMANCTIIKVHHSENKYKTEYTILFYDCTQPVKFPLKRMSLHRMLLREEEQTAYYYDSKKACKALLAQIDDTAEGDAEVTDEV